jgi:hypothetical protein
MFRVFSGSINCETERMFFRIQTARMHARQASPTSATVTTWSAHEIAQRRNANLASMLPKRILQLFVVRIMSQQPSFTNLEG